LLSVLIRSYLLLRPFYVAQTAGRGNRDRFCHRLPFLLVARKGPAEFEKHDCRVVLNGENVATLATVIFSILAGTGSKHLYRDESSGDVDLPNPANLSLLEPF
jgi:hypothetical protein